MTRAYAANGLNQYTSAGPARFTYDMNGNLTSDGAVTYAYDVENRIIGASGAKTANLRYDPLGRLYEVNAGSPASATRFLYDGDALVAEYDASSGALARRYVHGSGVDEPLMWFEGATLSNRRTLRANHQGSIIAVADSAGNSIGALTYDPYGIPGATNFGRFQYTGQIWLKELGVYHYKARAYSPTLGRFLQTDPIGYEDQVNLYAYVGNDPVNLVDPSGLNCEEPEDTVGRYCDPENPEDDAPEIVVTGRASVGDKRDNVDLTRTRIFDVEKLNPVVTLLHYVGGSGDTVCLTFSQFSDIVRNGENKSGQIPVVGKYLTASTHSTYKSGGRLGRSIGSGTVYRELDGSASGFYDSYNFDSKKNGGRSSQAEAETSLGSMIPGKSYNIVFPCDGVN